MSKTQRHSIAVITAVIMAVLLFTAYLQPSSAAGSNYWLKVNQKRNVITAYKRVNGKWKPVRAMLTSTGVNTAPETTTYNGTWYTSSKQRWLTMSLDGSFFDYGQYTAHLYGGIFIHSVWYYAPSHNAQARVEFNKLGRKASHGCIRVSTADAKWMYDNCPAGTKVTIYSSSKAGPLGKPRAIYVPGSAQRSWDPTDPAMGNPLRHLMPKPVIRINKTKNIDQYSKYRLLHGVSAKDPNSFMDLTKYLKVSSVRYRATGTKTFHKISTSSFTTRNPGTYYVTYYVNDPWGRSNTKSFYVHVNQVAKPKITGAKDRTVETGTSNAALGIKGTQGNRNRTSSVSVTITSPSGVKKTMSIAQAKKFVFHEEGDYTITYTLKSTYTGSVKAKVTIKVTANAKQDDNTTTDPDKHTDTTPTDQSGTATDQSGTATDQSGTATAGSATATN